MTQTDSTEPTVATRDSAATANQAKNDRVQIMFSLPAELKAIVEKRAETDSLGIGTIVRMAVADFFDYELPPQEKRARASKYATDEEREAAQKAKNAKRNNTIKKLLALYNSGALGEIDLDDDDSDDDTDD